MTEVTSILVTVLAGFLMGLAKGGMGSVLGALVTPMVGLAIPVRQAVGVVLPFAEIGNAMALVYYWRKWESWRMWLLLPVSLLGIVAGVLMLARLPEDALRKAIGALALLAALYKVSEGRLRTLAYRPRQWHALVAGGLSGFGSGLANTGGPPFTAYLLLQKLSPLHFAANTALFFAVADTIKVPFFIAAGVITHETLLLSLWGMGMVPLGVWVGKKMVDRINPRVFEALMLALLVVASVLLLATPPPRPAP